MSLMKVRMLARKAVVFGAVAAAVLAGLASPAAGAAEPASAPATSAPEASFWEGSATVATWSAPVAAAATAAQDAPAFGVRATCLRLACEGKGPSATGCGPVGALRAGSDRYARVELRYSVTCRAFWARIQLSPSWTSYKEVSIERRSGTTIAYRNVLRANAGTGWDWTLMAGGLVGNYYRACFRDPVPTVPPHVACTIWYRL